MHTNESVTLTRDVEASVVPVGTKVTLQKGEPAYITQSLGGTYTVVVNGNMFRIESKDADALGLETTAKSTSATGQPRTKEELDKEVWNQLKTCYDPEIPVNIVDLGLIYDCQLAPIGERQTPLAPAPCASLSQAVANGNSDTQNSTCRFAHIILPLMCSTRCSRWWWLFQ